MRDIRERKSDSRIKGKREGGKHTGKDTRRAMTVKFQRELMEQTRSRSDGGTDETPPEAQAVEQVEESAVDLAGGVKERTGDGISKTARYAGQARRERQSAPAADAAPTAESADQPTPRERMKRKAADETRARRVEAEQTPSAPKERLSPEIARERPSAPIKERGTAAPSAPKERMRQTAIKDKRAETREKPLATRERRQIAPPKERTISETSAIPATPRERGRQKAVADVRARSIEARRELAAPRAERPASPARTIPAPLPEKKDVSLKNQSINQSIRERPRHAAKPKEKPAGGAFTPKTRGSAKATGAKTAPATARGKDAKQAAARAKQRFRQNAQKKLLQQTNQRATKRAAILARRTSAAVVKGVASAVGAIAGLAGGAMLLPIILVIALVGAIAASPFGILFSNEPTPGAMPLNVAVGQLNIELADRLEAMQTGDYDSIDLQGSAPDWREVVAVFAAKTAGANDGVDVAALTPDRVDRLKAVFWDMCAITSEVETIAHPDSDPDDNTDDSWTERILHITITPKSADDMRAAYTLTARQNSALDELLAELSTMELLLTDLAAQTEKARDLLKNLPDDLAPERRAVVETACQLVGKVSYFWGGKSLVLGWDSRWGTIQKVWADGNSTTGTYRPYGLDCSGFVDWVFYNASNGACYPGHGGGATMQHTYCAPISWADAIPGDLVFYPEDSHVGIVGGRDADGNLLIIHCASSYNCVVITGASGFTAIGRPMYYTE